MGILDEREYMVPSYGHGRDERTHHRRNGDVHTASELEAAPLSGDREPECDREVLRKSDPFS